MNEKNYLHRLPIEENNTTSYFDGSLHLKMITNKILKDKRDLLKADINKHYNKRWALVILKNQFIPNTQSIFDFFLRIVKGVIIK